MLIHLLTPGGLSWTRNGVPKTDIAHERIKREKKNSRPEELCRGLPPEFEEFLRYCRRLKFDECPDYEFWVEEFRSLAIDEGFPEEDAFVWPPPQAEVLLLILVGVWGREIDCSSFNRLLFVLPPMDDLHYPGTLSK